MRKPEATPVATVTKKTSAHEMARDLVIYPESFEYQRRYRDGQRQIIAQSRRRLQDSIPGELSAIPVEEAFVKPRTAEVRAKGLVERFD